VVSDFRHKVDEHCILGYYTVSGGNPEEHSSQIVNPWLLNYTYRNLYNSLSLQCSSVIRRFNEYNNWQWGRNNWDTLK